MRLTITAIGIIIVGGTLGAVISSYFVGALNDNLSAVARVLGLCILLGYQAPNIWNLQEKILSDFVDRRIRLALGEDVKNKTDKPSDVETTKGRM
jgi:hypothetical protein